ncbi:MAG TPA: sigma-54-dependent Fis family transcriptional regulator [Burkholderiaceae bacterium]|nr:sigma-54-dependent Fis family transcriptional regulator [Burkholderiaceae bacterium]
MQSPGVTAMPSLPPLRLTDVAGPVADAMVRRSWTRAAEIYGLEPGLGDDRHVLTSQVLRDHVGALDAFLQTAQAAMTQLHVHLRAAGFVTLLADSAGVTVSYLPNPTFDREVGKAHLGLGTCFAEADEGTCGIGTCLAEDESITIHKTDHYLRRNAGLTCTAAPIHAPDGKLLSALCAASVAVSDDKRGQQLVMQFVTSAARLIEEAWFYHVHSGHWMLNIGTSPDLLQVQPGGLIALDEDGRIVALSRSMKEIATSFGVPEPLAQMPIAELLRPQSRGDIRDWPGAASIPIQLVSGLRTTPLFCKVTRPSPKTRLTGDAPAGVRIDTRERVEGGAARIDALGRLSFGDAAMDRNIDLARRLATRKVPIILFGETGSGKELFASAIHEASGRMGKFVTINCGAIPEALVESELFGYSDGAFTGARAKGRRGKILASSGGTLFLDEIGDMPYALQTRLLRALAEEEVAPLGSDTATRVDLRVVCATHQDLQTLVRAGSFRADLYHRLAGACIRLPPLRSRSDTRALVETLWQMDRNAEGKPYLSLSAELERVLLRHAWPGNIRQLRNVLRYIAATCQGNVATCDALPDGFLTESLGSGPALPRVSANPSSAAADAPRQPGVPDLVALLRSHHWCVTAVARALNVSRSTVHRRMRARGIVPPNRRD